MKKSKVLAAGSGLFEVEVSRMATRKATVPALRNFAQMLVDQHTMANHELVAVLHRKGVAPPTQIPPHLQAQMHQLSGLSGGEFDRAYLRMVGLQDHQHDIGEFERAIPTLADRDLRGWAEKTLPVMRTHLRDAQNLAGTMAG